MHKIKYLILLILGASVLCIAFTLVFALRDKKEKEPAYGSHEVLAQQENPVTSKAEISKSEEVVPSEEISQNKEIFIVCLDPGHPSEVSDGKTVQNGVTENEINWLIASEMKTILERNGIEIVMTKQEEDEYVTNAERAQIANESGADLLFRIHCDTGPPATRGMTFYYPDRQGTWNGHTGPPAHVISHSKEAATAIHKAVSTELNGLLPDRGVKTDNDTNVGRQQGGALRASILSRVPVVLVEVCFLSNPEDAAVVRNPETRSKVAAALANGIIKYLNSR